MNNEDFWIRFIVSTSFTLLEVVMLVGLYYLTLYINGEYSLVGFIISIYVSNSIRSNMKDMYQRQRIEKLEREMGNKDGRSQK